MSISRGAVLQKDGTKRPGEFTFFWSIHNYRHCTLKANQSLHSPDFEVDFLGDSKCWLEIYPRGDGAPGFASCYLRSRQAEVAHKWSGNFTLAIRSADGHFKEGKETVFGSFSCCRGYAKFVSCEEIKVPGGYLVNDTLTLRCRTWKTGSGAPDSVKWEAHSRIKVSKLEYTWSLKGISLSDDQALGNELRKSIDITEFLNGRPRINMHVSKKGSPSEGAIHFGIEMVKPIKNYFWIAVVHLIDASGRVAHLARGEHFFNSSSETLLWDFPPISKDKLYSDYKLCMPNNQLTLRCELSFAIDNVLENFVYRATNELEMQSNTGDPGSDLQGVWIKNMQKCYKNGKFGDFIIRTRSRRFPVSRNILSAHSEVFDAMFERNMKERKTGIVDIEDLDDDTVSNMLKYVYTSTLDSTDCSTVQKLYFAADKYGIAALQKKCSIYLMGCLDVSNVCDILELADVTYSEQRRTGC